MSRPGRSFVVPHALTAAHDVAQFHSGEAVLDDWLRQRALNNAENGASRTYVSCMAGSLEVFGYYALAMGQILGQDVTGAMRRNMPMHIPSILLGRLAVDRRVKGQGLGAMLLADAVQRCIRASAEVSARLIVVHALSAEAEAFYARFGFTRLPVQAPTLALDLVKFRGIAP